MNFNNSSHLFLFLTLCFIQPYRAATGFSDYIKTIGNYFSLSSTTEDDRSEEFPQRIPYEVSVVDEKFISEAAKLTGVALSELDTCQQRVVLKLKTDCAKMNDEQVAKMAVHLLNCQSYIEGRRIYPCTEDMSIKDCTTLMDSDTWTSYHLMSNRARAVCYSVRQTQFRGMAEHTVNRLMDAAHDQLRVLGDIAKDQQTLKDVAHDTLSTLSQGHDVLTRQQQDIRKAQFHGQLAVEDNIRKLSEEKALILGTHDQLVRMTENIQGRLEESSRRLERQTVESRDNHEELLDDLVAIQNKAQMIFQRIEESSELLLQQNENFRLQYEETLRNLAEVNKTVHDLVVLVGGTRQALEERLAWLTTALGGTDLAVGRLYSILWHSAFMLLSMLTCAFLSARSSTRIVVATAPPLNLALAICNHPNQLGPLELGAAILTCILGRALFVYAATFKDKVSAALPWKKRRPVEETDGAESSRHESETEEDFNSNTLGSPAFPLSRSDYYRSRRSRSYTPLVNGGMKRTCRARTRLGTPCKVTSMPGRDFCHRHQGGDSVAS